MNEHNILVGEAMRNRSLFGPFFEGSSWDVWRAVNKATFCEPMTDTEKQLFREIAEREPPAHRVSELACIVGRGGGKDSNIAFLATYVAMSFNPHTAKIRPGEQIYVLCLAVDKDQAGIAFGMIRGFFDNVPTLKAMVKRIGQDSISLTNRVVIKVVTNDYKSVRGRGILCAILDESAFWTQESSAGSLNSDVEVVAALAPGLGRVKNSMLIMISSAYRRTGMLYNSWKQNYGKDVEDILVVRGGTRQFNSTFPQNTIDKAPLRDRPRYDAEYNSIWRDDLQQLVSREIVEQCISVGIYERSPKKGLSYFGFLDAATGSGQDSFTLCIGHLEKERVVIDCLREVTPPFSPEVVSKEFAELLLTYGLSFCLADKFAGEWLSEQFSKHGGAVDQTAKSKSELYIDLLATLSSGRIDLLDHPKSINQICSLERRNRSGGRQQIDAPVGQHEDIANVIAGLVSSSFFKYNLNSMASGYDEDDEQSQQILAERKERARLREKYGSRGRVDYIFDSEADRKKGDAPVYRDKNGYRTDINGDQILGKDKKPYR